MVSYSGVKRLTSSSIFLIIVSIVVTLIIKIISADAIFVLVLGGIGVIAYFIAFILRNSAYRRLGVGFNAFLGFLVGLFTITSFIFIALTFFGVESCSSTVEGTAYIVCDPFLKYSSYAIYIFLGLTALTDLICSFKFYKVTESKKYFVLFIIKLLVLISGIVITYSVQRTASIDSRHLFLNYILLIYVPISIMDMVIAGFLRLDYNNGIADIEDEYYNYNDNPAKPLFIIQVILGILGLVLVLGIDIITGTMIFTSMLYVPIILIVFVLWNLLCAKKAISIRGLAILNLIVCLFSFQVLGVIGSIVALVNHRNY